jgi:hypothetical protein
MKHMTKGGSNFDWSRKRRRKIMKKVVHFVLFYIVFGFITVSSGHCANTIVNGQEVDESGFPVIKNSEIQPLDAQGSLDFDDMIPCLFVETVPVPPKFYKHFGFTIEGPNEKSGGAVLNECSGFDVTGYSPPNFLAFDCGAVLSTGGVPFLPEKLIFKNSVRGVSLKIGSGQSVGESIVLTAKTYYGKVVDTETVILTSALATVNLTSTKSNIKRVVISLPEGSNACAFVIDDISTTP